VDGHADSAGGPAAAAPPDRLAVDVAVAGAGLSGVFAAIASGRSGARTALVERFGTLGGNMGPGMIWGGSLDGEADITLPGGLAGIPKEFLRRLDALLGDGPRTYAALSAACSHVAYGMASEAGVHFVLCAMAADPVVSGGRVRGFTAETPCGRLAIEAAVTVDATGQATLAARAGAPIVRHTPPKPSFAPIVRPRHLDERFSGDYNQVGLLAVLAGVDFAAYEAFCRRTPEPDEADARWAAERRMSPQGPLFPILRRAAEEGGEDLCRPLAEDVYVTTPKTLFDFGAGTAGLKMHAQGAINIADWRHVSLLEGELRARAFDLTCLLRRRVPGCGRAHLVFTAPFIGARGGPCIEAEHVLTPEESIAGARFDDVIYVNTHEATHGGAEGGFDVPYRCLLPRGLDGMLVIGRGAGYLRRAHDPSGMRARPSLMVMGQAAGEAAALCVARGETPQRLDVRALQKVLLARGLPLGTPERLRDLGLA